MGTLPAQLKQLEAVWRKSTNDAIMAIRKLLTSSKECDREFVKLANWIATTDHNPWGFMPSGWEGSRNTAVDFYKFLTVLYHAMVDDGECCFVEFENGDSMLLFPASKGVDDLHKSLQESLAMAVGNRSFEWHMDAGRFITQYEANQAKWLDVVKQLEERRCAFLTDTTSTKPK